MGLSPGHHLGPCEVLAPIGAGGMGELYRARGTRLGRHVAVKVLPEHVGKDAEARVRFEREARTVADLHPDGRRFLFARGAEQGPGPPVTRLHLVQNWFAELERLAPKVR